MLFCSSIAVRTLLLCCAAGSARSAVAAERVLLRTGFAIDCDHHEPTPDGRVRLVLDPNNFMEVDAASIVSAEPVVAVKPSAAPVEAHNLPAASATPLSALIASAGAAHNINVELLQSVITAESGGRTHAVSRTGAQGLMQLMPSTARSLGVHDSFAPEDNLRGGTAYLDRLLSRYHNDLVLALAAYNAGPGAVDRYHGVPPYRETIAYVSRIVREFNRRTLALRQAAAQEQHPALLTGAGLP